MRRVSNRCYPKKKCINPACGSTFEPHDRRQQYCESQCRINAGNDRRFEANNTRFTDEKRARENNRVLESIWKKLLKQKEKQVTKSILDWEQFKFDSQTLMKKNSKTSNNILWYYDYGLELVNPSNGLFEIHKKS